MKKLLAQIFFLGFFLCCTAQLTSAPTFETFTAPPPGCALNAPTNFHIGTVTSHSAELLWNPPTGVPPGTTVTYKVTMYDNTASTSLATVYTTNLNYVYDGLPAYHQFTTTVSASACGPSGPFGPSETQAFNTSSIVIVDVIAGLGDNMLCSNYSQANLGDSQTITVELQSGAGQNNGIPPFGHFNITNGNRLVEFAIYAGREGTRWRTEMKIIHNTMSCNTATNTPSIDVRFAENNNYGTPFVKVFDPVTLYTNSSTQYVKIQVQPGTSVQYCGVPIVAGIPGSFLVHQATSPNQAQTNHLDNNNTDRTDDLSSDKQSSLQSIQLAPNPTGDRTMLSFSVAETGPVQLAVYNTMGALVALPIELPEILEKGNYQVEIPSEQLPTGMYFLTLQSATGRQTVRLMKQ